jgi:hypothetical protein
MVLRTEWSLDSATNTMAGMMFRRSFVDLVLVPPDERIPLYVDFYLSTFAALLTGTVAIYDGLYAYRLHGKNIHSNGQLFGGPYNSSKSDWRPIRNGILRLVQEIMQSEAHAIRQAFGDHQYGVAKRSLDSVLDPPTRAMRLRGRLRNFFPWL